MPIKFDIYPNPKRKNDTADTKYHARIITNRIVSEKTFADEISKASSLTPGDILGVLTELRSNIVTHLLQGERIHLPGIGYMELSIDNPEIDSDGPNFSSKRLKVKTIKFQPEKELKQDIRSKASFERIKETPHSAVRSEKDTTALLRKIFKENDMVTRKQLGLLMDYTPSKTYTLLRNLKNQGHVEEHGFTRVRLFKATPKLYDDNILNRLIESSEKK
jgi:predicted histone-like DNA-binding protein